MRANRLEQGPPPSLCPVLPPKVLICSPVTSRGAEGPSEPGSEGTHVEDPPGGSGTALGDESLARVQGLQG